MKYKNILMLIAVFTVVGAMASYGFAAKAEDNGNESVFEAQKEQLEARQELEKRSVEGSSEAVKQEAERRWEAEKKALEVARESAKNGTSTSDNEEDGDDNDNGTTTRKTDKDREDDDATEHRSVVAGFVRNLLSIASSTRDGGIGNEVRTVAKEQNDDKDDVAQAIDRVKNRNAFLTFLIGADFKNLGELRSSIVTTDNHISRLTNIKSKASSTPEIQTALDEEITALKAEKERLNNIVSKGEGKISLLGWLVKLLQK
ncbi:MAG: hypothetical protein WC835_03235 [Candidatus Paceibacterota bacterium]|jgi:hypothetical protein